jgi:carboxymethylenebutenolidase
MVSVPSGLVQVVGYLAQPRSGGPFPGVIIVHENRGMTDHFKDIARRLAKAGYVGLAVDLLSPRGGTDRFTDQAQINAFLFQTPADQFVPMLNAGMGYLRRQSVIRRDRIGTMGFCFGGGIVWQFATQNPELRAAVPFYGRNPSIAEVPNIKAAVLAIYGALDTRLNAGIPAVREAMQAARVVHEVVIYPNADHAFFSDTGQRYNETAARGAWTRTLSWFERYLKGA